MRPKLLPNVKDLLERYSYKSGEIFDKDRNKFIRKLDTTRGYYRIRIFENYFYMHRIVYAICKKNNEFMFLDHINGDRKDNRIKNLREATDAENTWNKKLSCNNSIGIKGVRYIHGKYQSRIMHNGKSLSKLHNSLKDAENWLFEKRLALHKAFANNGIHQKEN